MITGHKTCGNTSYVTTEGKVQGDAGDLDDVLALAEYEIQIDAYRGLVNFEVPSPWFQCRHTEQACGIVSQVADCACPSLISWTREYDKLAGRKKRKRNGSALHGSEHHLGRRRQDPAFWCPCDHNPFCLASLGGVMDDFLAEAAAEIIHSPSPTGIIEQKISKVQHIISVDDSSDGGSKVEVVDVDEMETHKSQKRIPGAIEVDDEVQIVCCSTTPEAPQQPKVVSECTSESNPIDASKTPAEAFLEDISFAPRELDHTDGNCVYTKVTMEQLAAVRREAQIDLDPIRSYVDFILLAHPDVKCNQTACIDRLQRFHNKMLFTNPVTIKTSVVDGKMRFAVPPGMKNLGATCYLNTQLQCLARNTAFLDGIFAWRPSQTESRMDSVLSTLQQIMARLTYGVEATCATEDFSQALGLQNDEMQDPNEFARLLFQRMHEAFQQSSKAGNGSERSSLATLLPTLFEGDMTYQTQCHSCGRVTERSEKFMDINLPIAHPTPLLAKGKCGQLQINEAFALPKKGDRETSVQFCLDKYMCAEELEGDNQYWCDGCATKRDATRHVVFTKLPPVLNLQLCRYVYDRKAQTKKKLTDRVLLPRYLDVNSAQESESSKYRLCAVMKHLGNSAYQGHYIAESMDWQTGTWFEFDDEKVEILGNGPTCSPDGTKMSKSKVKGSQDAYNIYYVKESFLGSCALHSITDCERRLADDTTRKLESERQGRYDMLADMCRNDVEVADRRRRRKRGLLTLLKRCFRPVSPCVRFGSVKQDEACNDSVWVDGAGLRTIFSCDAPRDDNDLMHSVSRKDLICGHYGGLDPRIARCGKVVSVQFFEELIELLRTEQGCPVLPLANRSRDCFALSNIACRTCSESYRASLRNNLELVLSLRVVFQELDPKNEGTPDETENDDYVYAVSKRFVTTFRKSVAGLFKRLVSFDETSYGVDSIKDPLKWDKAISDDGVDVTVNSAIMCKSYGRMFVAKNHSFLTLEIEGKNGKCSPVSRRSVRHVSERLWGSIKALFPQAIDVKKPKSHELVWMMCSECEGSNMERESLEEWASLVTSGLSPELLKGRRKQERVLPTTNLTISDDYYLVHRSDIDRLWESCKIVKLRSAFAVSSVKYELERNMFSHTCSGDDQGALHEQVLRKWSPTSLLCSKHCLVLNPAVFVYLRSHESDSATLWRFNDDVIVLSSNEYRHFLRVVVRLYDLLFPIAHDGDSSSLHGDTYLALDAMCATLSSSFHPQVRAMMDVGGCSEDSFTFLTCRIGSATVENRLTPAMCADQRCNNDCIESLRAGDQFRRTPNDKGSNGVSKETSLLPSRAIFEVDDDVQVVSGPANAKSADLGLSLRIVAVEEKANLDDFIASLVHDDSQDMGIRRSGRKRKQRYPLGGAKVEEFLSLRRCHNLAAVRLHVLEKLVGFEVDQPLILLLNCDGDDKKKMKIEIPSFWNTRSMSEVVVDATKSLGLSDDDLEKVYSDMTLIFHATEDAYPKRKNARNREGEAHREALMESLLLIANLTDQNKLKTQAKNGTRRVERGFSGTFLQSSFEPAGETGDVLSTQVDIEVSHEDASEGILNSDTCVYVIAESDNESVSDRQSGRRKAYSLPEVNQP